jgi:hypothetical protein
LKKVLTERLKWVLIWHQNRIEKVQLITHEKNKPMKMKLLGVLTAGVALTVMQAQAQIIPIENQSFELPATVKITTGWDTVPGWYSGTAVNSGVEGPSGLGFDGLWAAFSWNGDAANNIWANQNTHYTIQSGDRIDLNILARSGYTFIDNNYVDADATLHYRLWTVEGGGPVSGVISQGYFDLGVANGGNWTNYTATIPNSIIGLYAGQTLGISLYNTSGLGIDPSSGPLAGPNLSWVGFDDLRLSVPEPGTIALLTLGGLSALVAVRRRRA